MATWLHVVEPDVAVSFWPTRKRRIIVRVNVMVGVRTARK